MSDEIRKSLASRAPSDHHPGAATTRADDDFGVLLFTGGVAATETTHKADELPSHWAGHEIGAMALGGICHVAFSKRSGAEVARDVAATAVGVAATVGVPLPNSAAVETRFRLPQLQKGEKLYFVRESDTVGTTVRLRILD